MNLHVYQSPFTHESRMLRETGSLAASGLFNQIIIGALWEQGLQIEECLDLNRSVWRVPLCSRRLPDGLLWKVVKFGEWELRLFTRYLKERIRVFNAHSLIGLPLGVLFKVATKCKLVYDTHELETETQMGTRQRAVYKFIERLLIPYVDITLVVNNSIADWYRNTYNLNSVHVIRNVPNIPNETIQSRVLRDHFRISDTDVIFLYQGILEEGRGIHIILECFSVADRNKHIVFMGMGALEGKIKTYENEYPNIHFHKAVPPSVLPQYTASADVGLSLIENTCLNYYYCLPNKIFEYFMSGLPAIVSNFPEMSKVIEEGQCGWAIPVEKGALLNSVNNLSREEITEKKIHARQYATKSNWQDEDKKIQEIYRDLLALPSK